MSDGDDFSFTEGWTKFIGLLMFVAFIVLIVLLIINGFPDEGSPEWIKNKCGSVTNDSDCIEVEQCRNNIEGFHKMFEAMNCSMQNITVYPPMTGVVPE